jgi:hypothetical protein
MPDNHQDLKHGDNSPVLEELSPGSDRLYFIFGGIMASVDDMLPFEFYKTARILGYSKIFFRDFSQSWYQCGLRGIANDIYDLSVFLKSRINELQPKKIYFVGNSMGGFAAILFSSMLGTGKAIAFSPQSCLSFSKRLRLGDSRWRTKIIRMYGKTIFRKHYYDLQNVLIDNPHDFTIDIHVSRAEQLDMKHALALQQFRQVRIHQYDLGGHTLVRHLRDNNMLASIMAD